MAFVLNYYPGDKHIFYLPTYLFIATAIGTGVGGALDWLYHLLVQKRKLWFRYLYLLLVVVLVLVIILPYAEARWRAVQVGVATFVQDTYPYPRDDLEEPRRTATLRFHLLPADAFLVMNWRALYTTYYLAHVEGLRPNLIIKEATPHGSDGKIADTLLQEITDALHTGRPVFVDEVYDGLREHSRVMPAPGGKLYRITLP